MADLLRDLRLALREMRRRPGLASWAPARRASRVDPAIVLRE